MEGTCSLGEKVVEIILSWSMDLISRKVEKKKREPREGVVSGAFGSVVFSLRSRVIQLLILSLAATQPHFCMVICVLAPMQRQRPLLFSSLSGKKVNR